ncbi:MAG: hypothetical protein ACKOCN_00185, partial [Planctomycetaceae bacterium]
MPLLHRRSRFSFQSLVRSLFSRSVRVRGSHHRPHRPAVRRASGLGHDGCGFDTLEGRAMLAVGDIGVS